MFVKRLALVAMLLAVLVLSVSSAWATALTPGGVVAPLPLVSISGTIIAEQISSFATPGNDVEGNFVSAVVQDNDTGKLDFLFQFTVT